MLFFCVLLTFLFLLPSLETRYLPRTPLRNSNRYFVYNVWPLEIRDHRIHADSIENYAIRRKNEDLFSSDAEDEQRGSRLDGENDMKNILRNVEDIKEFNFDDLVS